MEANTDGQRDVGGTTTNDRTGTRKLVWSPGVKRAGGAACQLDENQDVSLKQNTTMIAAKLRVRTLSTANSAEEDGSVGLRGFYGHQDRDKHVAKHFSMIRRGKKSEAINGTKRCMVAILSEARNLEKLDAVWEKEDLPALMRERWRGMPTKVKVGSGYQEQMDKLHADRYTDAEHIIYVDTGTVVIIDVTREQWFDDVDKPKLCHRRVVKCGEQCGMLMQNSIKLMLREGERLDHEVMNLGEDLTRFLFPDLHLTLEDVTNAVWNKFTASILAEGTPGWCEPTERSSFTDANAMGAMMWREFRDRDHWIDIESSKFDTMVRSIRTWSGKDDEVKRQEAKRRFEYFRNFSTVQRT